MEIIIRCPNCGMELEAPDEMVGRPALCPGCQRPFVVQAIEPSDASAQAEDSVASPVASNNANESSQASTRPSTPGSAREPSAESAPQSSASGKPRFKGLDPSLLAELGGASTPSTATGSTPSSTAMRGGATSSAAKEPKPLESFEPAPVTPVRSDRPNRRERKSAKLITSASDNTRLTLGADGQLPELLIKEANTTEKRPKEEQESSPVLLIVALVVSVSMSVLLLFIPTQGRSSQTDVADSIAALQEHYIGSRQPLEPYQLLVRKAIQAENKGDLRTAIGVYRELLQMLHEERPNENQGLTGPRYSNREPNDGQLESHLRVLLSR